MKPFYLIAFPLVFLVATGFIYTNYLMWSYSGGDVTTIGSLESTIPTTDPLFNLLTGQYSQMFSSLGNIVFGTATFSFNIPWIQYAPVSFGPWIVTVPWFRITWLDIQIPQIFGFWTPAFSIPWLEYFYREVTFPAINLPWFSGTSVAVTLPGVTAAFVSIVAGSIMLVLGLGLGISAATFGVSISDQGTKLLQVIGLGMLIWGLVAILFTTWLSSMGIIGTVILAMLELMFILGIYWQSQTTV